MGKKNKVLVLFDFDGTITRGDSLVGFLPFMTGIFRFLWGMVVLSPVLIAYVLKLVPNDKAKQKAFVHFFKNWDEKQFLKRAYDYSLSSLPGQIRSQALEKIQWHQEQGHRLVLVSASMEAWLKPWCDSVGMECVATRLEIIDGKMTGRFLGNNCYGIEKVNRIKAYLELDDYSEIYAYGDSRGDREMLELAQKAFYKPF